MGIRDNGFNHKIEAMQQWVNELRQHAVERPEDLEILLRGVFEQLHLSLEELQVTNGKLRQQSEKLATAQEVVEAERQRYRELFEFAPDGYMVTDPKGVIQEVNRAAASLLHGNRDFLLGKPLIVFVAKEDRETFHTQLSQLTQSERVQNWEVQL